MSTLTHPLNNLLSHRTTWNWNQECIPTAIQKLASTEVLVHYDTNLPLKLACNVVQLSHTSYLVVKNDPLHMRLEL